MATTTAKAPKGLVTPAPLQQTALAKLAQNFSIELAPCPMIDQAQAYQPRAAAIVKIADADSHRTALEAIRDGKRLARDIDAHWRKVLRWLEDRKVDIRTIMAEDLKLVEDVGRLSAITLDYETAEKARIRIEEERQRQEAERTAQAQREAELAEMERQALANEAEREQLSDRERAFVQRCYGEGVNLPSDRWLNATATACGFKQDGYGVTLYHRPKIQYALDAMRQAAAMRQQANALKEKPVEAATVRVGSNLAKVAGMRTVVTYTGECYDYRAFVEAFQAGTVDLETFLQLSQPSETGGNALARAMRDNLNRINGWRCIKRETKAG